MSVFMARREIGQPPGLTLGSLSAQTNSCWQVFSKSQGGAPVVQLSPAFCVVQAATPAIGLTLLQTGAPQVVYHLVAVAVHDPPLLMTTPAEFASQPLP